MRWPREPAIDVALALRPSLIRLIAIFERSGFTSTYGDERGAIARITDGACATGDIDGDAVKWRNRCQFSVKAVFARC